MKRPLALYAAPAMLLGKSATLFGMLFATTEHYRPSMFVQPLVYGIAAVWLYFYPKSARWLVGAFFLYVALREAVVLPTFQGTTLDLVRRPFSFVVAVWFAYALLAGKTVRFYIGKNEPNKTPEPTSGIVTPRAEPRVAPIPPVTHL
jgi:hypothetical protein